jgi:hypothetical protein
MFADGLDVVEGDMRPSGLNHFPTVPAFLFMLRLQHSWHDIDDGSNTVRSWPRTSEPSGPRFGWSSGRRERNARSSMTLMLADVWVAPAICSPARNSTPSRTGGHRSIS